MQIATWNVNSLSVRLPQVLAWLAANPVDALCLQELKLTDDKFPHDALKEAGYEAVAFGQKTYNGVAILSRHPLRDVVRNIPDFGDEQARVIAATLDTPAGPLRLLNGYFVNGQEPGSEKFAYKMRWLQALQDMVRAEMAAHPRLVLVGDPDQLPSVGAGNVFGDLIRSERVATVALKDIFRQAERSAIVRSAHLVNEGRLPELQNTAASDFFFKLIFAPAGIA